MKRCKITARQPNNGRRPSPDAYDSYFGFAAKAREFEFHGHHIRSAKGCFKGMAMEKLEKRLALMSTLISILELFQVQIVYAIVDKMKNYANKHPHQLAFLFLVERLEDILRADDQRGLLTADENREIEQCLIDDLDGFKCSNTGFGWKPTPIRQVIDSIHFVRSSNNWLIQLADVVAFLILRGRRAESDLIGRCSAAGGPTTSGMSFPAWV